MCHSFGTVWVLKFLSNQKPLLGLVPGLLLTLRRLDLQRPLWSTIRFLKSVVVPSGRINEHRW